MFSTARAHHVIPIDPATPDSIQLLPAGTFSGRDGRGPYRNDQPDKILDAFTGWGMPLLVDYHHQTLDARSHSGMVPAAGWAQALTNRDGQIWGQMEWTATAAQAIKDRELLYISPVFDYEVKSGRVLRLVQAALLNDPNLYLQAVASMGAQVDDLMEKIIEILNLPVTSSADEVAGHLQRLIDQIKADATATSSLRSIAGCGDNVPLSDVVTAVQTQLAAEPSPGEFVPRREFERIAQALAAIQQQQAADQVKLLLEQGARDGKISPAMQAWAQSYAAADPAGFVAYLQAAPVLVVPHGAHKSPGAFTPTHQNADPNDADGFKRACQAQWDADESVRAEFRSFSAYHAYRRADALGLVKIRGIHQ